MVLKPVRRRYRANNSSPAYEVNATSPNSSCRSPLTRARKSSFLCLIVEGLSLLEEGLGRTSFQPQRKAFFNDKVSVRDQINDSSRLTMRYGQPSQLATLACTYSRRSTVMCALPRAIAVTTVYERVSAQLEQPLAQPRHLGARMRGARRPQPQFLHEDVRGSGEEHAQLIRPKATATGAADLESLVQLLDPVFDVAA